MVTSRRACSVSAHGRMWGHASSTPAPGRRIWATPQPREPQQHHGAPRARQVADPDRPASVRPRDHTAAAAPSRRGGRVHRLLEFAVDLGHHQQHRPGQPQKPRHHRAGTVVTPHLGSPRRVSDIAVMRFQETPLQSHAELRFAVTDHAQRRRAGLVAMNCLQGSRLRACGRSAAAGRDRTGSTGVRIADPEEAPRWAGRSWQRLAACRRGVSRARTWTGHTGRHGRGG